MSKHTPGPWDLCEASPCSEGGRVLAGYKRVATVPGGYGRRATAVGKANARLIAAAPDHSLVLRMIARGVLRWEPFRAGGDAGELVFAGLRHSTQLDEFGCPILTDALRAAIAKAEGGGK